MIIVLTGKGFYLSKVQFTGATGATFDGVAATDFTVVNDTTITCTTPAHAAGSVNVAVTGPGGSGTVTNVFTYENPTPNPTTVNPNTGSTAGGTAVTITGTGFTGATGATFDGVAATDFTVVNDTTITCTTPAHAAGSVNLAVTGPGGSGTLTDGFTYEETIPNPTSINPNSGSTSGGTNVTITGSGFTGVTEVTFALSLATNLIVVDDNTITCTTPAHSAGLTNVLVFGPGGIGVLEDGFTFENPIPNPTNVSPSSGSFLGGTSVTITGSGFTGATGVTFDGVAATSVTVVNDTTITCATPLHLLTGSVDVAVTGPGGSGVLPNGYTYTALK
ncbi:IPT/TIG domain-containing protein [Candidiatus Paracoxiella cheracis]|uniref:IPT/TIG domain-containing protein n=1 Tax=Candidiatus Paracoxiella cheracis TaxID=3405120 RepID=UPI003BF5600B